MNMAMARYGSVSAGSGAVDGEDEPTPAAYLKQEAEIDGINPYTSRPLRTLDVHPHETTYREWVTPAGDHADPAQLDTVTPQAGTSEHAPIPMVSSAGIPSSSAADGQVPASSTVGDAVAGKAPYTADAGDLAVDSLSAAHDMALIIDSPTPNEENSNLLESPLSHSHKSVQSASELRVPGGFPPTPAA
jgi:hypothetical protein